MITEFIFGLVTDLVTTIIGWLPVVEIPAFLGDIDDSVNAVLGYVKGFGGWVSFPYLSSCVIAALGVWLACLVVKALRAAASYVPMFGGAG
jgi:hypothetical protein